MSHDEGHRPTEIPSAVKLNDDGSRSVPCTCMPSSLPPPPPPLLHPSRPDRGSLTNPKDNRRARHASVSGYWPGLARSSLIKSARRQRQRRGRGSRKSVPRDASIDWHWTRDGTGISWWHTSSLSSTTSVYERLVCFNETAVEGAKTKVDRPRLQPFSTRIKI